MVALFSGCAQRSDEHTRAYLYQYQWNCAWDGSNRSDTIAVYYTPGIQHCPVMIFHRGRGFDFTDYNDVLTRISSSGIICVSVSDSISFVSRTDLTSSSPNYDYLNPALGMESASYSQIEALNRVLTLNNDVSSPVYNTIDPSSVYFAGHSRGGGATEFCQSRAVSAKGFIYYMAFDVVGLTSLPPLSPTPSLIFAATLDGNLGYALTSGIQAVMTGPSQLITIYGGNHDFAGDFNSIGESATISRKTEHQIIVQYTVSFIK